MGSAGKLRFPTAASDCAGAVNQKTQDHRTSPLDVTYSAGPSARSLLSLEFFECLSSAANVDLPTFAARICRSAIVFSWLCCDSQSVAEHVKPGPTRRSFTPCN